MTGCVLPLTFLFLLNAAQQTATEEEVLSGPQPGEPLPAFRVQGVFDDEAGKELDFVSAAKDGPIVLIFVHDVNRQSVSFTRILSHYTAGRSEDGLSTGVVWLVDDLTEGENTLKRIRHALAPDAPVGLSVDGREGPGSYGLNRKVTLTILVADKGRVTANFALIQPSLQADLMRVLERVVEVAGGEVPKLEDLPGMPEMSRTSPGRGEAPNLRPWLAPVIRKDASPEEVDEAAIALEQHVADNPAARKEVGRIANTIIDAGKLEDYGTPRAQEYLTKWAKEFGRPDQKQ